MQTHKQAGETGRDRQTNQQRQTNWQTGKQTDGQPYGRTKRRTAKKTHGQRDRQTPPAARSARSPPMPPRLSRIHFPSLFLFPRFFFFLSRVYRLQEGFGMDTLVDAGLVPDTSKWKYPTSPNVRGCPTHLR